MNYETKENIKFYSVNILLGILIASLVTFNVWIWNQPKQRVNPVYKVVETMKWDSIQKHEHEYVYSIKRHENIAVLVDHIVKNEKLKRLYYTLNDSALTLFVDSLKEVETAIKYYYLEQKKVFHSERFNDFKPHSYIKPHIPY